MPLSASVRFRTFFEQEEADKDFIEFFLLLLKVDQRLINKSLKKKGYLTPISAPISADTYFMTPISTVSY